MIFNPINDYALFDLQKIQDLKKKNKHLTVKSLGTVLIDVSAPTPAVSANEGVVTAVPLVSNPAPNPVIENPVKNIVERTKNTHIAPKPVLNEGIVDDGSNNAISELKALGFSSANETPEKAQNVFILPGAIGEFLQSRQPHKELILIKGTKHTSKSQIAMQIANSYGEKGDLVCYIDYEQGGVDSKDTINSVKWNTTPKGKSNILIIGALDNPFEDLKKFCRHSKVIIADSVTDLKITADQLNELRNNYVDVSWIFISQVKENGAMYGGNKMAHNPTCIIECHPSEDPRKRYATLEKNRGNDLTLAYSIFYKKLVNVDEFTQEYNLPETVTI